MSARRLLRAFIAGIGSLIALPAAMAHCPLCTVATGAAVSAARFYGVDDALMGVLIGGFVISSALWLQNVCKRRGWIFFPGQGLALVVLSLLLTIVGFKAGNLFVSATPQLLGMPRLLSGMLIGSVASVGGYGVHEYIRRLNNGKNHVALQGMAFMLAALFLGAVLVGGIS